MAGKTWHSEMSMTDRLSAGMEILSACKTAFSLLEPSEVKAKSKSIEEGAFDNASSKEHYHELWHNAIRQFQLPSKPSKQLHTDEPPGPTQQIGHYRGTYHKSGLFSTIFSAPGGHSHSYYALKLTTPSHMSPPHNSLREARLLKLGAHKNVIYLHSTFQQPGGHLILVFPFMSLTLEDCLEKRLVYSFQLKSHLHDLFNGLAHVHSLGIIHRDIKPSNILLLNPDGPAYIADFGIAWKDGDPDSEPADKKITDVGTTAYRPPELLFGNSSYNSSLDMWAAGCVVAESQLAVNGVRKTLFDAGELGSELALIQSIFITLGTPNEETWPEAVNFPDWGKMRFYQYPAKRWEEMLPGVGMEAMELVRGLVRYQSGERLSAEEVMEHTYFKSENIAQGSLE